MRVVVSSDGVKIDFDCGHRLSASQVPAKYLRNLSLEKTGGKVPCPNQVCIEEAEHSQARIYAPEQHPLVA